VKTCNSTENATGSESIQSTINRNFLSSSFEQPNSKAS
jgi:hypothetical protein